MIVAVLAIVGIVVAIWLLLTLDPNVLARTVRGTVIGTLGVLALFLTVRGLAILDLPLGGLMIYLVHHWSARGFPGVARLKDWVAGRPHRKGSSTVETGLLRMTLDQASGALQGEVLGGQFAGTRLDQLSLAQLRTLLSECRASDVQSERLLETYLDRTHPDWREHASGPERAQRGSGETGDGPMSREEALQVLGLERNATPTQIREAHRRLMTKLHPDQGGTDYLASKINTARDMLLKRE